MRSVGKEGRTAQEGWGVSGRNFKWHSQVDIVTKTASEPRLRARGGGPGGAQKERAPERGRQHPQRASAGVSMWPQRRRKPWVPRENRRPRRLLSLRPTTCRLHTLTARQFYFPFSPFTLPLHILFLLKCPTPPPVSQ